MIDIPSRHRPLALLAGVVLAQVLLLAFQIKRERDVRLIRVWSVELLTPLQRTGNWMVHGISDGWHHYVDLRHTRLENEELRAEVEGLKLRNRELESRAGEAGRFSTLLGFREAHGNVPMFGAEVIGASADPASHTIYVNRGSRDGVHKNMGVITPDGVVGKIAEVYPTAAQVLVITDRDSGVGALLTTSRTHGVVKGTGDPFLRMEYVVTDENVAAGEAVVTSGEDRIFPKDLPIGTVIDAQPGNPFKAIRVRPAARLDRLEEILVLQSLQELNLKKEAESNEPHPSSHGNVTPAAPSASPPASKPPDKNQPANRSVTPPAKKPEAKPVIPPGGTKPAAGQASPPTPKPEEKKPPSHPQGTRP
jgi:rod shape-determining protein MreC